MKTIARFGRSLSFDVNLKGPYFLFQALLPVFARPASVVLNTSISAHVGAERSSVYAATKAAFLSMAKTLSSELLGRGIRVNAVSPGPIETPLYDKFGIPDAYREQLNKDIAATIPFGRFGTPEEVAKAVLYLASDESRWTLGSEIVVDGGTDVAMESAQVTLVAIAPGASVTSHPRRRFAAVASCMASILGL